MRLYVITVKMFHEKLYFIRINVTTFNGKVSNFKNKTDVGDVDS